MLKWTICYEIVTPESAENGDTADNGFVHPSGLEYSLNDKRSEETLQEAKDAAFDRTGSVEDLISDAQAFDTYYYDGADWLYSLNESMDAYGELVNYSLHIEGVTDSTKDRIHRLVNGL